MSSIRWMVYPAERLAGYCPTYCMSEESANRERERMEGYSGVKWNIKKVEK